MDLLNCTVNFTGSQPGGARLDPCGWKRQQFIPHAVRHLDHITYPILLLVATVGNVITIMVLKKEKPYGSKGIYLSAVAAIDLLYMWGALLTYISIYENEVQGAAGNRVRYIVDLFSGALMFLQEFSVIASAWLIASFTVERFVAIRFPLQHLACGHKRRCFIIVTLILFASASVALVRLIDYYWVWLNYIGLDPRPERVPQRPPLLARWHKIYLWGLAVIQIVNFLLICIFNALLLYVIAKQNSTRSTILSASRSDAAQQKLDKGAVTLLLACVMLYLITQSPGFIYNVWDLLSRSCIRQMSSDIKMILAPILNLLLNVNFSVNFMLYCGASPKFRSGAKKLVMRTWTSNLRKMSLISTMSESLTTRQSRSITRRLRSLSSGSTQFDAVRANKRRMTENQENLLANFKANAKH